MILCLFEVCIHYLNFHIRLLNKVNMNTSCNTVQLQLSTPSGQEPSESGSDNENVQLWKKYIIIVISCINVHYN